jgi:hypothetical protein
MRAENSENDTGLHLQPALGNQRVRAWMEGSGHEAMMDTSCEDGVWVRTSFMLNI